MQFKSQGFDLCFLSADIKKFSILRLHDLWIKEYHSIPILLYKNKLELYYTLAMESCIEVRASGWPSHVRHEDTYNSIHRSWSSHLGTWNSKYIVDDTGFKSKVNWQIPKYGQMRI